MSKHLPTAIPTFITYCTIFLIKDTLFWVLDRPVSFGTKPQNPKLTNPKQFWAKLLDPKPKDLI